MTERQRAIAGAARAAVVGVAIAGSALIAPGQALAEPAPPNPPPPGLGVESPAPGQPVLNTADGPVGSPPPSPNGPPPVPEIQNPQYGAGSTPGQLGYLRDIWHTFHDGNPIEALTMPPEQAPGPPPGAGPAPKLPPGYTSLTDPSAQDRGTSAASGVLPAKRTATARMDRPRDGCAHRAARRSGGGAGGPGCTTTGSGRSRSCRFAAPVARRGNMITYAKYFWFVSTRES
jgi:hypothetical protein